MNADLFALARKHFKAFLLEFAGYGMEADPGLELRQGTGLLAYYDMQDGHIYMSIPDLTDPAGKLHMLFLRSMLKCENQAELDRLFRLFIPFVIAHELAHHFRHRFGLFDADNLWREEQIANQLAVAVTKHRLSPDDKAFAKLALPRALDALAAKLEAKNIAVDSYHNILHALNVSGQIGAAAIDNLEMVQKLFEVDPAEILRDTGQLSPEIVERLDQRDELIEAINQQYASDYLRYFYYQIGWLHLALSSRETEYVEEFARLHLNRRDDLLPVIDGPAAPNDHAIQACFKAYRDTLALSDTVSRFFYKRYRGLLLARLQAAAGPAQADMLTQEATALLQTWKGREKESDALIYLSQLAPPALRRLFPHQIADHLDPQLSLLRQLPTETDVRLWRHISLHGQDDGAAQTLYRLELLDRTDIYRPLPAEVMLDLAHSLRRVKLAPGETIIWEGEQNDDVFILMEGRLEVCLTQDGELRRFATIQPGEVFGEMAFFTQEPRNATVRAVRPSECFVLKDSDLRLFAFKYPVVLIQMAGVLARRLANFIKAEAAEAA